MKLGFNSLYLRLVLVLATALVAGFVTMGFLFHRHIEQDRARGVRHGMAGQIRLIENLLTQYPQASIPDDMGLLIYRGDTPRGTEVDTSFFSSDIARRISEDLGHPVEMRHSKQPDGGLWIRLAVPDPTWLRIPLPGRPGGPGPDAPGGPGGPPGPPGPGGPGGPGLEPWTWGLLVSFFIVFVGGMALLWRVQVPLRKLEQALDATRPTMAPHPLELKGPGEVQRLAERFNRMTARLYQYEQDREVMLAGVAHDLRAPVTRLRLQLELENSTRRNAMLCNLDSIEAIVDQFLLYARGGESEAATEWDMNAFLAEVTAPYEEQGVNYSLQEDRDIIAPIQPSSLRRALCNLIENSLEYGSKPVEVSLQQQDHEIVFTIRDHGPGIAEKDWARALRPFTRLDDARARQGHCGLGLAIACRIAESHGGTLTLENAPDGGLLARLSLPTKP